MPIAGKEVEYRMSSLLLVSNRHAGLGLFLGLFLEDKEKAVCKKKPT